MLSPIYIEVPTQIFLIILTVDFSIPDDNYWDSEGSGMSSYEDETDMELGETKPESLKEDKKLIKYMKQMDQELVNTTIGKSFVPVSQVYYFLIFRR